MRIIPVFFCPLLCYTVYNQTTIHNLLGGEPMMNNFGIHVKELRIRLGFSQKDVYEKTGIAIETLRTLEKGLRSPRLETLEILSQFYKYDLFYLYHSLRNDNDYLSDTSFHLLYETVLTDLRKLHKNNIESVPIRIMSLEKNLHQLSQHTSRLLSDSTLYPHELLLGNYLSLAYLMTDEPDKSQAILEKLLAYIHTFPYLTETYQQLECSLTNSLAYVYQSINRYTDAINLLEDYLQSPTVSLSNTLRMDMVIRQAVSYYYLGHLEKAQSLLSCAFSNATPNRIEYYADFLHEHDGIDIRDISGDFQKNYR